MRLNNPKLYPYWTACYLDGREVTRAFGADEESGIVWHYDDPPRVNEAGDGAAFHVSKGGVKIVLAGLPNPCPTLWIDDGRCPYPGGEA